MKCITEITKRDIFELFRDGYENPCNWLDNIQRINYCYYGSIKEIDFLKRLYPLDQMPSLDERYENAGIDIWQHTINNDDYPSFWIFEDERFPLKNGSDEELLKFLCEIFHPAVRNEKGYWKDYLEKINNLLRADGYELYENEKISNRYVYSWRQISLEESQSGRFIPFSIRNKKAIEEKKLKIPLVSKRIRNEFIILFNQYEETQHRTTETNWNYSIRSKEAVIEELRNYYIPKAFNSEKKYSETKSLNLFVMNNHPYCVFDAIELFEKYNKGNSFADEVNNIFQNNSLSFRILGGKIESTNGKIEQGEQIIVTSAEKLKEKFSSEYITAQIDLMLKMQKDNPTEAIGKAKELIESCCKTILEDVGISPDKNWDIVKLVDETTKLLKVTPKDIPDNTPEITAIKAILGNLKAIATNVAYLRNSYGSGHGKSANYKGLEERHAKLAVGSSITLVNFLWDSHDRINK